MKELKVDKLIVWDKEEVRLLSSYPAILVEVRWLPGKGNGYLEACHPSTGRRDIRWDANGTVSGVINGNTRQQVVVSGTILRLVLDAADPHPEEWVVAVSPSEIKYVRPKKGKRKSRKRKKKS